jgi:RNA polymerase sigma-70 factor (ECF subfamily)
VEPLIVDQGTSPPVEPIDLTPIIEPPTFDAFYCEHRTGLIRAMAVTLHDLDAATDAVDEALARACQHWGRIRTLQSPAGWVYRVALNLSRSRLRRLGRRLPGWALPTTTAPEPTPIDPSIEQALAGLTVDQRSVVVCRLLLGWSEARTAEVLGVRPGTVKSRLSRAVGHLQPTLSHLRPEHQETEP